MAEPVCTSSQFDFDDESWLPGFYFRVMRLVDRVRGRQGGWWYKRHRDLGRSPLSALCDGEIEAVDRVLVRGGRRER